jgi:hypothetical protein
MARPPKLKINPVDRSNFNVLRAVHKLIGEE